MAEHKILAAKAAAAGEKKMPPKRGFSRGDSRKLMGDDGRRDRFKERGKDLERGISAPSLFAELEGASPKAPLPRNEGEVITVGQGLGHDFAKKTFFHPTYCHHCSELLWGIKSQGFICKVCNYISHDKCVPSLSLPCRHVMADMIQKPVAHSWTKLAVKKKTFCNICRKKVSSDAWICEVCKYYCHTNCKAVAFNNCKECATYSYGSTPSTDTHHWIEGNLHSGARCQVCTKSCASTDCLTGFRCGWCGISVHTKCQERYQKEHPSCCFRDLWGMILLPRAIRIHNVMDCSTDPVTPTTADAVSPVEEEDAGEDETDGGGKGKPVIVVDGSGKKGFKKWRKTTVHPTYLNKKMTTQELLVISLKKCGISDDPANYYLSDMVDDKERELLPDEIPYNIQTKGPILKLHIRHKETKKKEEEEIKGKMHVNNRYIDSDISRVVVLVTSKTTVKEIVEKAIAKFELEPGESSDYCLVEISQVEGVMERVLADTECPWKKYADLRRDSLTLSSRQRYSLKQREKGETSIYLKKVPKEVLLEKEKYSQYVKSLVPPEVDVSLFDGVEIGPAFPSMGGLVLTFKSLELASKLIVAIDQNPTKPDLILLPSIYPEITSVDQEPLLVFVNGKSGGNQGVELLSAFRRHLNPHQVWDLSKGGPIPGLWSMRNIKAFRILIGGGDGTFGWVLGGLQVVKEHLQCKDPPSALLPLGTGNDLARALKWGGGYSGEKVMQILLSLEDANVVQLDRWDVTFKDKQLPKEEKRVSPGPSTVVMNNYCGVGLDAAIALDFHLAREENPEKFSSRLHNKGFYLQLGLQKMVQRTETRELRRHIALMVDGNRVELPDIAGLIVLNIQSWGAGADPWGTTSDPTYKPAAYDDGLLEVVGIKGVMQMGQVQSGIRNAVRIAQGSEITVDLLSSIPVQVDGEAWAQPPCTMAIRKLPDSATLLQGSNKHIFSRLPSKKEETFQIALQHTMSSSEILASSEGLSTRRSCKPQESQLELPETTTKDNANKDEEKPE